MRAFKLAASVLLILLLAAGTIAAASHHTSALPQSSPTYLPTSTAPSLAPTPVPSHTPTPTPTRTPLPSPTPSLTPAPDPWAAYFSPEGPYLCIKDADRGPWSYKDETLSVTITIPQSGTFAKKYYKADIYTRGPLPFCGFAQQNPKATSVELPYKIAREYKAVLAVTGEYIAAGYNPKGVIICDNRVYYDRDKASTMAVLPSGDMRVYEPGKIDAAALQALGVKDSFSFGPILVTDGKVHPGITRHKLGTGSSLRAAIGQVEPGHYVVIVTRNGLTLTALAKLFVENGCGTAYNLDGGHSAALVFMGEQLNKNDGGSTHQRGLPDMLMIGTCDAVPCADDPVYGTGIYHHNRHKPKPTDGLIKQARTGA